MPQYKKRVFRGYMFQVRFRRKRLSGREIFILLEISDSLQKVPCVLNQFRIFLPRHISPNSRFLVLILCAV